MRIRTLAASCVVGLLSLLAGCVPIVTVTAENNGQTVKAAVGNRLVLNLAANITTGYDWKITAIDAAVLKQVGESTYKQDAAAPGTVGAGGTRTWHFDVKAAGTTTLTLEYRRSWEPDTVPAAQTFTTTIEAAQ